MGEKVIGLSKTFGGALPNSDLLKFYHIRGPLEDDKLCMLREERLAIMMMQDVSVISETDMVCLYRLKRRRENGTTWRSKRPVLGLM